MAPFIQTDVRVFTDASFDPATRMGVTGYLVVPKKHEASLPPIVTQIFYETHCARLELEAVLCALRVISRDSKIQVFTDSKTISGLTERRAKLTKNDFKSRRTGAPLSSADLY